MNRVDDDVVTAAIALEGQRYGLWVGRDQRFEAREGPERGVVTCDEEVSGLHTRLRCGAASGD